MNKFETIESPSSEDIQPIISGVVSYGESLVRDNTPKKIAFRLEKESKLIGGIVGSIQYDRFYLSHIWVHESHRNKGLGSELLSYSEQKLKRLGCTSIILETLNNKAASLYRRQGYEQVGCIEDYVKGFNLVHMLKKI